MSRWVTSPGLAWHLEASVYMGRMDQFEDCGANDAGGAGAPSVPEESQYWAEDGRRVSPCTRTSTSYRPSPSTAPPISSWAAAATANGFKATAAAISSIFVELPRSKSHSHAHPEAYLYALQGAGYSEIGGKQYTWEQGDAVHVPPGMMHHQHFNPSDGETRELRFEFGIRYWLVDQWKGYTTIDKHLKAMSMDEDDEDK